MLLQNRTRCLADVLHLIKVEDTLTVYPICQLLSDKLLQPYAQAHLAQFIRSLS